MQWQRIFWNQVVPTGTGVAFQVATMTNATDTPVYTGPSGTSSWFSTSGASLSSFTGRFCRFKVKLTPTATTTPSVSDVQLSYTKLASQTAALLPSQVRRFVYDNAGNLIKTNTYTDSTSTASALVIDTRDETSWVAADRVNNLNQIKRRDVGGVTYKYTYNLNGCLTQKRNAAGTDIWDYTWNQENRLTQAKHTVSGSVVKTITFSYDSMGRMLTRSDGTTTIKFTWDAWHCVSETDGTNITTYMIPEGQLLSFKRGSNTYQVHCDALGSVRLVTDSTGGVVARFDYSAWGELLGSSFDNVPNGGMPYRFVGSLGVRWDTDLGLHYMRNRWYDSALCRFVSKDPIGLQGGVNLYTYTNNRPSDQSDSYGLSPGKKKRCKVFIFYSWVFPSECSYHTDMFVVCYDDDNKREVTRYNFGPTDPGPCGCYSISGATGSGPGSGPVHFRPSSNAAGELNGFLQNHSYDQHSMNAPSNINQTFQNATNQLVNQQVPYTMYDHNSNAAIDYLLQAGGMSMPTPSPGVQVPYTPVNQSPPPPAGSQVLQDVIDFMFNQGQYGP